MPFEKPSNCLSSSDFFFLPMARRRMSAWPSEYPATFCAMAMTCSWYTIRPYVVPRMSSRASSSSGWMGVTSCIPFLRSA
ncbi:hypothetical protein D3C74_392390 [compost metagenome]